LIKKERTIPLVIPKCEALLRRLPDQHPKRPQIEEQLAKSLKGYNGEKSIDYFLSELLSNKYYIFYGLRLPKNKTNYAQIDVLILTKFYILIIEVKNISGEIKIDTELNQMIRKINDKIEVYNDPFLQLERHKKTISTMLQSQNYLSLPIETLLLISDPSTYIEFTKPSKELIRKTVRSTNLVSKIESIDEKYRLERLSIKDMNKLSRSFIKKHTPLNPDVLSMFQIDKNEIQKGVHCPKCSFLPIHKKKNRNKWYCPKCNGEYQDAHLATLRDYALLISQSITNQECRDFLQITSSDGAYRILQSLNLEQAGEKKTRRYHFEIQ